MMIAAHLMKKGTDHVYEPNRKSYADDRDESLSYVAPEVLLTKNTTYQTDIYSFGILLYEIMTSLSPHQILTPDNLNIGIIRICNGLRPVLPKNIPGPVEHLITQCWDSDPSRRPKIDELNDVLRHMNSDAFEKEDAETNLLNEQIEQMRVLRERVENTCKQIEQMRVLRERLKNTKSITDQSDDYLAA
ncbi:19775_t:CDS:2 [Gigaspora rosea]|nr:19775_t:CDS:2 [Gigaspora rosea]